MCMILGYIQLALNRLASLDPAVYPNLCYYQAATTVFRHLEAILKLFQSKAKPAVLIVNKGYFVFSQDYIKLWSKNEDDCGGTTERWQSHKVFLKDLGLIETYQVDKACSDPVLNRIWNKAKAKGQKPESLWTIPLYNDDLLLQAEQVAVKYRYNQISVSHLRKTVLIRFRGQKIADWLYSDRRVIGEIEETLLLYCRESIKEAVNSKGYTTFKEMITRVHALCTGRLFFQQVLAELLNPEEAELQKTYQSTMNLILQEKALLCHEAGCVYRQIRKTDREEMNLPKDLKSWIITQKQAD